MFKNGSITRHMGAKSIHYVEECAGAPSHHSMNEYRFGGIRWESDVLGIESQRERQAHSSIMQTLVYVNREDESRKKDAENLLKLTTDALKSLYFLKRKAFCLAICLSGTGSSEEEIQRLVGKKKEVEVVTDGKGLFGEMAKRML